MITAVTNATDNLVQASGRIFSDLVKLDIPVGDLLDAMDTAGIHYSRAFASLHVALKHDIDELTAAVRASCTQYEHTDHWVEPMVTTIPNAC